MAGLCARAPQKLFPGNVTTRGHDAMPDGNRFLVAALEGGGREVPPATVIVNWQAGLKTAGGR